MKIRRITYDHLHCPLDPEFPPYGYAVLTTGTRPFEMSYALFQEHVYVDIPWDENKRSYVLDPTETEKLRGILSVLDTDKSILLIDDTDGSRLATLEAIITVYFGQDDKKMWVFPPYPDINLYHSLCESLEIAITSEDVRAKARLRSEFEKKKAQRRDTHREIDRQHKIRVQRRREGYDD